MESGESSNEPIRALTLAQYEARRIELGFAVYDPITNTFWSRNDASADAIVREVDADTLEPVTSEERNRRFLDHANKYGLSLGFPPDVGAFSHYEGED